MSGKRKKKVRSGASRAKAGAPRVVEWVGAISEMPAFVRREEGGAPYRPSAVMWVRAGAGGTVLGVNVVEPVDPGRSLVELFEATVQRPMIGPAHSPGRVRVASAELAERLRAALPAGVEVVEGPTPESDRALASLAKAMSVEEPRPTFLGEDVGPAAMARFFRAAARLYRARPWAAIPGDGALAVGVEALGVRGAVVYVAGQPDEGCSVLVFDDAAAFDAYVEAARLATDDRLPPVPRHTALTYERRAQVPRALVAEVESHHWEIAGPAAYPVVAVMEPDLLARAPGSDELRRVEAIALGLLELVTHVPALASAWDAEDAPRWSFPVSTDAGPVEVTLSPLAGGDDD